MGKFFGFLDNENEAKKNEKGEGGKLLLREEELDISKDRIETGAVNLRKEIVEEKKVVDVPLAHEEVIIERRAINEPSDSPIGDEETIHIPVSEERVEVGRHTMVTGEISAHKHEVEEMHHVDEILRREEARVDASGDPNIVSDETVNRIDLEDEE